MTTGGAGIYISNGASPRIHNSKIDANTAAITGGGPGSGAGAWAYKASAVFTDCTFTNNLTDNGGVGGGVYLEGSGTVKLISCTLQGNQGGGGGGAAVAGLSNSQDPELQLINCLIVQNETPDPGPTTPLPYGGGVLVRDWGARVTMINCTVAENLAKRGGAIAQVWKHCPDFGAPASDEPGHTYIYNSILWNNELTDPVDGCHPPEIYLTGGDLTVDNSDVSGGSAGIKPDAPTSYTNNLNSDPQFSTGYRLICGSLCINEGLNSHVPADTYNIDGDGSDTEPTPDRELEERIVPVSGGVVDMGAYEHESIESCAGDTNDDGVVNVTDLLAVINQWDEINCPGTCTADVAPASPCPVPDGNVDVLDLLMVINTWGCATGIIPFPASLSACYSEYCNGLSGSAYTECITKCTEAYCSQDPTPEDCE